ncbi:conserved hypothetical protein [Prochlorococcus marinus str. MIT 9313]|uniref:NADP-dependent oxidoreductase domain-containing protein n=1 Tax=Prochlorococcus marinus (strain MIT 9313) TaxID=74547 RepID=Q7V961_PROMM|nr:aldo/keto reductase [Prochlorococcus marinus]CAE20272.1 conserved hypothetical protein [Prochlorococcus marinus str. MIT 9313]
MTPVQLSLGTAQFGLDYGVTNRTGQVPEDEVKSILLAAQRSEVRFLDTAQAYGDSESVLGRCLDPDSSFCLISKLPAQTSDPYTSVSVDAWEVSFQQTLIRLGCSKIDSFLLHQPADLLRPDSHFLLSWLSSLRKRSFVRRVGVSVYSSSDLDDLPLDQIQIVQLPLSLYDQRALHDGTISRLNGLGIAVHARSTFLQGLLLTPSEQWPAWIDPDFRLHHSSLEAFAVEHNLTLLSLSLGFVQSCSQLEAAVVGVTTYTELMSLLAVWMSYSTAHPFGDPHCWAWPKGRSLDPRLWPS